MFLDLNNHVPMYAYTFIQTTIFEAYYLTNISVGVRYNSEQTYEISVFKVSISEMNQLKN